MLPAREMAEIAVKALDSKKGKEIRLIRIDKITTLAEYFVICTGTSTRHVVSIADHVVQESRAAGLLPLGVEGEATADWVVVDLGDVIVHVMQEESRRLYELEKLWG